MLKVIVVAYRKYGHVFMSSRNMFSASIFKQMVQNAHGAGIGIDLNAPEFAAQVRLPALETLNCCSKASAAMVDCHAQATKLAALYDKYAAKRSKQTALQRQQKTLTRANDTLAKNQERLRQNLEALKIHGSSKLANRYGVRTWVVASMSETKVLTLFVLHRYMNDMNNDEDELIRNRKQIQVAEEKLLALDEVCWHCFEVSMHFCVH